MVWHDLYMLLNIAKVKNSYPSTSLFNSSPRALKFPHSHLVVLTGKIVLFNNGPRHSILKIGHAIGWTYPTGHHGWNMTKMVVSKDIQIATIFAPPKISSQRFARCQRVRGTTAAYGLLRHSTTRGRPIDFCWDLARYVSTWAGVTWWLVN